MRQFLLGFGCFIATLVFGERDPFWPIGYASSPEPAPPEVVEESVEPVKPRVLTDQELRKLAEEEAAKIKEILDRDGTAVFGGKVHALINGSWVSVGDSLTVEALGKTYRLQITALTTNHIDLKPQRTRVRDR